MKNGYTLLELVIVIALTVIILITATSLFFATFVGGGKTASAEYTKQAGQNALNQITYLIRNARKLAPNASGDLCGNSLTDPSMDSLGLVNQDGRTTILRLDQNRIASNSGIFLTPSDLTVVNGAFDFTCNPTSYGTASWDGSPPRITVSFTLQKGVTGVDKARDIVTIPFQSDISMRNF